MDKDQLVITVAEPSLSSVASHKAKATDAFMRKFRQSPRYKALCEFLGRQSLEEVVESRYTDGVWDTRLEIAQRLLDSGYSTEEAAKISGLRPQDLHGLKPKES